MRTTRATAGIPLLALLGLACQAAAPDPRPNLILVVIDNLRADHVSAYGYERQTSPNIDRLAAAGTVFTRATAVSSWTKPSVASLFTSRLPSEHGATSFDRHLSPDLPTLAETLAAAGYRTIGISANFVHTTETTGLARGFETWISNPILAELGEERWVTRNPDGTRVLRRERHGMEVNHQLFQLLRRDDARPSFIYLHYMEPQVGYQPPARFRSAFATDPEVHAARGRASSDYIFSLARSRRTVSDEERQWLIDLYDAEIALADASIENLVSGLEKAGLWKNSVLLLVSDHGEEFGEHGTWWHGTTLHREVLAVPLIIFDARVPATGIRREEVVDLLDVPTTLLARAGVKAPDGMRGRDLMVDGPLPARPILSELHPTRWATQGPRLQRIALTHWPWSALQHGDGSRLFYRLDRDPYESTPISESEVPPELEIALEEIERESATRIPAATRKPMSREYYEQLRGMGYLQ